MALDRPIKTSDVEPVGSDSAPRRNFHGLLTHMEGVEGVEGIPELTHASLPTGPGKDHLSHLEGHQSLKVVDGEITNPNPNPNPNPN